MMSIIHVSAGKVDKFVISKIYLGNTDFDIFLQGYASDAAIAIEFTFVEVMIKIGRKLKALNVNVFIRFGWYLMLIICSRIMVFQLRRC